MSWDSLPTELQCMILNEFSYRDSIGNRRGWIETVAPCLLVSRTWNSYLQHQISRHVNIERLSEFASEPVLLEALRTLLQSTQAVPKAGPYIVDREDPFYQAADRELQLGRTLKMIIHRGFVTCMSLIQPELSSLRLYAIGVVYKRGEMTLLEQAIEGGSPEAVKFLLDNDVEHVDFVRPLTRGALPPHCSAIMRENLAIMELLLVRGAHRFVQIPVFEKGQNSQAWLGPLYFAATKRNWPMMRKMLENGLVPELEESPDDSVSALIATIACNNLEMTELLLSHGARINAQEEAEAFPMGWAAVNDSPAFINLLLERGGDIDDIDSHCDTALFWAITEEKESMVRLLLDRGAYVHDEDLVLAVTYRLVPIITLLLSKMAPHPNSLPAKAVSAAVAPRGLEDFIKLFLELVLCPRPPCTPIEYDDLLEAATKTNNPRIVDWLLVQGADPRYSATDGHPLLRAVELRSEQLIDLLLDHGADINAREPRSNHTALEAAVLDQSAGVVERLLKRGARINVADARDGNALYLAAERGDKGLVRILVDHGADVNAESGYYGCALQVAAVEGHDEVVRYLWDCGADIRPDDRCFWAAVDVPENDIVMQALEEFRALYP